jgi:hypothetical protein
VATCGQAGNLSRSRGDTEGRAGTHGGVVGSVPHIHICRPLHKTLHPTDPVRARDGAFGPESWVGSAIQPYPFFLIRADSRDSRASPTYSHGRGLPWLQLNTGRRGISHGGTQREERGPRFRNLDPCPNLKSGYFSHK